MSITEILSDKDMPAKEKLAQIVEVIAKAREAYGNAEAEITPRTVNTTEGSMKVIHLTAESKLALVAK